MTKAYWYQLEDPGRVNSPGLIFYEDRIQENIDMLLGMIDHKSRLRPHVKTHKSSDVTKMMLAAGLHKFKCATIAEAEMLGLCEAPDVLLAYQSVGPNIHRFLVLQQRFPNTRFSCLVDNQAAAESMVQIARQQKMDLEVYIDLNVGMNRTGIRTAKAINLYAALLGIEGLKVLGFHAYDGHIHDHEFSVRQNKASEIISVLQNLSRTVEEEYQYQPVIIAGGTPTFPIFSKETTFECSPGTFALWDGGYQKAFAEQPFLPAALVISRVVSLPNERLICLDLGHKAVAAENTLANRITFLNAPELVVVSQSEEHLVLDAGENHGYQIGDVLYGLPVHICPTVALYDQVMSVSSRRAPENWSIQSRKRIHTI